MNTRAKNLQELYSTSAVVQRIMRQCLHQVFDELGIAPSQLQLLQYIELFQPVSLKELAIEMRLSPGAITQLVEGLVTTGYVKRLTSANDRRVIDVSLTSSGKDKIGLLKRKKQILLAKVVKDLDDNELELYLRVQHKMLSHLETLCPQSKTLAK
jgi:DNA-binding MarR family transcriptional regulator